MNGQEPAGVDLDPALEHLMSEMDDALFAGRPTDEFEREIAERFGESPSQIVSTLKALHSARAASLSHSSSGRDTDAPFDPTRSTSEATTWVRATAGLARTVFGRFEILERLGSGGAGTVFRARDSRLERLVALKVARAEALFSSEAKQRFVREAQTLAALRHPNIIPIYEFGESGGLPYIVEELCDGPNLDVWLRRETDARHKLPIRAAVQWTLLLAEAVAHAHQCGIVHRDLKPSNVLLMTPAARIQGPRLDESATENFVPRVTDFGIAKLFGSEEGVTASQAVLGTAAYMAPEQAEGRSREVGPPADVYSLGVILYELLSGRRPIEGRSDVDTLRRVLTDEPLPLTQVRRDVPLDLEAICLKCLDKNSANRYPSAAELADDLAHFLKGEPVGARRLRPVARIIRRLRRRQLSSAALPLNAFFALAILTGIVVIIIRTRNSEIVIWQAPAVAPPRQVVATRQTYPDDIHQASLLLRGREVDVVARNAMSNQARQILGKYIPHEGREDLRGFEWHYLWQIAHPQMVAPMFSVVRTIAAHRAAAYFVCFSPDGKLLATASADGTARVWDVETGQLRFNLAGHTNEVNCVVFAPDGKTLATASEDGTVRLWDGSTGAFRETLWKHDCEVVGVAFNPANGQLACSARDGVLTIWDCTSSHLIETIHAHSGRKIDDLTFSPDGKLLATAGADSTVGLRRSSAPSDPFVGFKVYDPLAVGFSHDGQFLAVGHMNGARIFSVRTGEFVSQIHFPGQYVRSVQFSADDSSLLTVGDQSTASLVDLTTGETWDPFGTPAAVLWCAAVSPSGKLVATTDSTGKLVIWDCSARGSCQRTQLPVIHESPAVHLSFSPDGRRVAIAADAEPTKKDGKHVGEVAVWDVSLPSPKRLLHIAPRDARCELHGVAFSPDGGAIAYCERRPEDSRERIRVVDAETGALRFETAPDWFGLDFLFFSPDASVLVSQEQGGRSPQIRLQFRDARTGTLVRTIPVVTYPAPFAVCPNENLLATLATNRNSRIDLYRLGDQQRIAALGGFGRLIHSLAFTRDGRSLIGRGEGGYIGVVSRDTGAVVRQFTVSGVTSVMGFAVALSLDGRALAIGSRDGIVLADFESGKVMCSLPFPHEMVGVRAIAFIADGQTVAASAQTSPGEWGVYLWRVDDRISASPAAGESKR
jgi:eukaryotic-like serine/threonine-protein kinase